MPSCPLMIGSGSVQISVSHALAGIPDQRYLPPAGDPLGHGDTKGRPALPSLGYVGLPGARLCCSQRPQKVGAASLAVGICDEGLPHLSLHPRLGPGSLAQTGGAPDPALPEHPQEGWDRSPVRGRLRRPGARGPRTKEDEVWSLSGAMATTESVWRVVVQAHTGVPTKKEHSS
jgi:hypothetical protein